MTKLAKQPYKPWANCLFHENTINGRRIPNFYTDANAKVIYQWDDPVGYATRLCASMSARPRPSLWARLWPFTKINK